MIWKCKNLPSSSLKRQYSLRNYKPIPESPNGLHCSRTMGDLIPGFSWLRDSFETSNDEISLSSSWPWRMESVCQPSSTKPLSGIGRDFYFSHCGWWHVHKGKGHQENSSSLSPWEFICSWRSQDRQVLFDRASALECFLPGRWVTSRLCVSICCNHLAVWTVGIFRFFIHVTAALSIRKRTFCPKRYEWKVLGATTTASNSLLVTKYCWSYFSSLCSYMQLLFQFFSVFSWICERTAPTALSLVSVFRMKSLPGRG